MNYIPCLDGFLVNIWDYDRALIVENKASFRLHPFMVVAQKVNAEESSYEVVMGEYLTNEKAKDACEKINRLIKSRARSKCVFCFTF